MSTDKDTDICKDAEATPVTPKGGRDVTPTNQALIDAARAMPTTPPVGREITADNAKLIADAKSAPKGDEK